MNREEEQRQVGQCAQELLDLLKEHAAGSSYKMRVFLCAYSHVLGFCLAQAAEDENLPVELLLSVAEKTIQSSARSAFAQHPERMQ